MLNVDCISKNLLEHYQTYNNFNDISIHVKTSKSIVSINHVLFKAKDLDNLSKCIFIEFYQHLPALREFYNYICTKQLVRRYEWSLFKTAIFRNQELIETIEKINELIDFVTIKIKCLKKIKAHSHSDVLMKSQLDLLQMNLDRIKFDNQESLSLQFEKSLHQKKSYYVELRFIAIEIMRILALYISSEQKIDCIKYIIKNLGGLNASDSKGASVIHYAAAINDLATLNFFCGNLKLLAKKDLDGHTPLHIACLNNHYAFIDTLYQHGIDIKEENEEGHSIFHLAILSNNISLVNFLIKYKFLEKDYEGCNALHLAVEKNNFEIVELLYTTPYYQQLKEEENYFGERPVDIALKEGYDSIIDLFYKKEAIYPYKILSLYKEKRENIAQRRVLRKLNTFLKLFQRDTTVLVPKGNCNGFSFLAIYYASRDKLDEFYAILKLIVTTCLNLKDPESSYKILSDQNCVKNFSGNYKNLYEVFEQWINDIVYFQYQHYLATAQTDSSESLQKMRFEQYETVKKDKKEFIKYVDTYCNYLVNVEQMINLLKDVSKKSCIALDFGGGGHSTSAYIYPSGKIFYYDPNYRYRIKLLDSAEQLSTLILKKKYKALGYFETLPLSVVTYKFKKTSK